MEPEDAVERQVRAYNARDLEGFVASYAQGVVVEDAEGKPLLTGHDELKERYRRLFADSPSLRAEIVNRIRIGSYVIDEERVSGLPEGGLHAVAIYRLDDAGLIDLVRFLR